jgi:hypothetical protein
MASAGSIPALGSLARLGPIADSGARLLRPLCLASALVLGPASSQAEATRDDFYAAPANLGASLPADAIYPRGRRLAFMGYSGNPGRDLTNGFTVAGPVYGNQAAYLERCFTEGWPVVAHVGPRIRFADQNPARYRLNEPALRRQVETQVQALAGHKEIVWWAIAPEELRPWRSEEMNYLSMVCQTIRAHDPQRRPIFHYNPNHRNADTLSPIARQVDVLAKGCYVNHVGRKRDRAWVRWSIEQELQAIGRTGCSNALPLLMPELCRDPEPAEDKEIGSWVRHDVYLGLCSGAQGVLIWSLYPRKEVRRTWPLWYDAYAECAKELNGKTALAQVFLFGERRSDLKVRRVKGESTARVTLGGSAEPATTTASERAKREIKLAAWTSAEFAYGSRRWLFLVNSANSPATFSITGWPEGSRAENAFNGSPLRVVDASALQLELPAYGVTALSFGRGQDHP